MSTMPYAEERKGGKFLTLFVIAIIIFAALKLLPLIFGNVDVQVAYSDHAGEHDEADAIRCSTRKKWCRSPFPWGRGSGPW